MSQFHAHQAIARMNMREVAVAASYNMIAQDLYALYTANAEIEEKKLLARREELCSTYGMPAPKQEKPFAFTNGIAIIPISGTLINRFGSSYGSVTGYNYIRRQQALALADDDVKGIVYDVNSNGGECAGCFELADEMFEARGKKPSMAVIDSNCYSAGYALASSTGKMVMTPSGGAGSIGVVAMHVDISKALDNFGVKVSFIKFGAHKVDGNPFEPLSEAAEKEIQASVNNSGAKFVALVARNRSMEAAKVKGTEARCYRADDALSLGLIDTIATPSQAMQVFFDELTGSVQQPGKEDAMSQETTQPAASATPAATDAAALAQAADKARTDERARVKGIMGCEEAKGRAALATHLAMETTMSVEAAQAVLKAAAPEAAATSNAFKDAMDNGQHPNVGAGTGGEGGDTEEAKAEARATQILKNHAAATGAKLVAVK